MAVIDPLPVFRSFSAVRAALIFWVPSAASTALSLQQILAWCHRLLVDLASVVSRNQRMKRVCQQHVLAAHSKTWAFHFHIYSTDGRGLKKTYIGESQLFWSRT